MSENGYPPDTDKLYVYAIIPGQVSLTFDVAGLGDDEAEVYTIPQAGLAAVVSASPLPDYRRLDRQAAVRYLIAHQRVLETVMSQFPLLPVKFGTVLPGAGSVTLMLEDGGPLFRSTIEQVNHLVQMELVVMWNPQDVFKEIGSEEDIVHIMTQAAAHPETVTKADRVGLGQLVQASLERRRTALRQQALTFLLDVVLDAKPNPLMDDRMAVNVALLLAKKNQDVLYQRLDELDRSFAGKLDFKCVGPLPPYSFAMAEVQVPCFEEVTTARRQLGLAETTPVSEIRRAYRQLASQLHPDRNPQDSLAQTRMTELTQAYQLLTAYAQSRARTLPPADWDQVLCHLDRPTVERTLLISVHRQEAMA
jgi:DnaJ-domain-containing protein 1